MKQKIYCIGIGWIGVSALARYYLSQGWRVYWSDANDSELIHRLQEEWCNIIIWADSKRISQNIDLVIYTEAIPPTQEELLKSHELNIKTLKYNEALWEIVNQYKLIAITGTHGKSTTTSMISQILKNSNENFKSIVWTLLKEFEGKNFYSRWEEKNYFVIEACEYKEHFLAYKPTVAVITNIEYDHADYFKTPQSYIDAYEKFIYNIVPGWFCVFDSEDPNSKLLIGTRTDIHYIDIQDFDFPEISLNIPGEHILSDAKLAYIVGHMIGINDISLLNSLEDYSGVWRRMEKVWTTLHGNLLMSDYGHHPSEVQATLKALKDWYPDKKIYTVFQPHQYSRTIELFEWFKTCFLDTDILLIPNIYESRDSEADKQKMNTQLLVDAIKHDRVINGGGLDNTLLSIEKYDLEHPNSSIILLLWAGNVDNLRYKIKTS